MLQFAAFVQVTFNTLQTEDQLVNDGRFTRLKSACAQLKPPNATDQVIFNCTNSAFETNILGQDAFMPNDLLFLLAKI
jgi:hypothetical protein